MPTDSTGDAGLPIREPELFKLPAFKNFDLDKPVRPRRRKLPDPTDPTDPPDPSDPRPISSLHVLQRVQLLPEDELTDPFIANVFSEQEFLAASAHFGQEIDAARAVRTGEKTYARVIRDGVWARFRLYTTNFDIVEEYLPLETLDPVPVGELHCPNISGSTGTFTSGLTTGRKIGLRIRAAGFAGGGWTEEKKFHQQSVITISAGHCAVLVANLSGDYSIWQKLDDRQHYEVLVNITGIGGLYDLPLEQSADFDPREHICTRDDAYALLEREVGRGRLRVGHEYDRFAPSSTETNPKPYVHQTKWTREREYHRSWGLSVTSEKVGELSIGGDMTSTFVHEVEIEAQCPKNHSYIGRYRSARELPQQWGVSARISP